MMNVLQATAVWAAIVFSLLVLWLNDAQAGDPHHDIPDPTVTNITNIHNQVIRQYSINECDARGSADHDFSYATRSVQVSVAGARCQDTGLGETSLGIGFRPCVNCGLGKVQLSNGRGGHIISGAYTMTLK